MWLLLAAATILLLSYTRVATVGTFEMTIPSSESLKTIGAVLGGIAAIGTLTLAVLGKLGASFTWLSSLRTRRVSLDERLIKLREEQIEKLLSDVKRLESDNEAGAVERAALRTGHDKLREQIEELQTARIADIGANKLALERLADEKDRAHEAQFNTARLEHEKTLTAVRTQFAARIEDLEEQNAELRKENDRLQSELRQHRPSGSPTLKLINDIGPLC